MPPAAIKEAGSTCVMKLPSVVEGVATNISIATASNPKLQPNCVLPQGDVLVSKMHQSSEPLLQLSSAREQVRFQMLHIPVPVASRG